MMKVPIPAEPLKVALIGAGNRAATIYGPLLPDVGPWIEIVAVCDPVDEHRQKLADTLGVPAYADLHELAADRPMEAAVIVTPVPSHYAINMYLIDHGIHCHCETSWCSLVEQGRNMIAAAADNGVTLRVAENFIRFPVDRFAQTVRDSGYLGDIKRVVTYNAHTGYHNKSRWNVLFGNHPEWVQSIAHGIPHAGFFSMPQRYHTEETYRAHFFGFPEEALVVDHASNVKCWLGRHPRQGYEEFHGSRGTLVHRTLGDEWGDGEMLLRRCSDDCFSPSGEFIKGGGIADEITPVRMTNEQGRWIGARAETPDGPIEYVNPLPSSAGVGESSMRNWYGGAVIDHLVDFALAVRGMRVSEFTPEDALMSLMMDVGAKESISQEGRRVELPLGEETAGEAKTRQSLKDQFNCDPMDVEAMLAISYPQP